MTLSPFWLILLAAFIGCDRLYFRLLGRRYIRLALAEMGRRFVAAVVLGYRWFILAVASLFDELGVKP